MDRRLHSHGFNEISEGFVQQNKVIVDVIHKDMFISYEVYDENHIIVDFEEFKTKGGVVRFVAIRKK